MNLNLTETKLGPFEQTRPEGYSVAAPHAQWECERCGAFVSRTDLHNAHHQRVDPDGAT